MKPNNTEIISLLFIVIAGLGIRLWLATGSYNYDIVVTGQDVALFNQGKNIYQFQTAYNYTPFIYWIIGLLGKIQGLFPVFPLRFVVRSFTSLIDLLTLLPLLGLATKFRVSRVKTALLFFLNPVTITISGHHGQYDNIAILGLLTGLWIYTSEIFPRQYKILTAWIAITLGFVVKHIILIQVMLFWKLAKKNSKGILLFAASVCIFFLSFLPYISAYEDIKRQVFRYGGLQGFYGLSYFTQIFCAKCTVFGLSFNSILMYIFLPLYFLFAWTIRHKNIARALLISVLFFMTFTTGIAAQYFVLPIALGALFPTKWFYLYSISTFLFFLGSIDEYQIPAFGTFTWNTVWLFAGLWFISEVSRVTPWARRVTHRLTQGA